MLRQLGLPLYLFICLFILTLDLLTSAMPKISLVLNSCSYNNYSSGFW